VDLLLYLLVQLMMLGRSFGFLYFKVKYDAVVLLLWLQRKLILTTANAAQLWKGFMAMANCFVAN